jgi:alkylation response protein AidB-like acyl-CoA dehydrogenase
VSESGAIDADELAMLAKGFTAAMAGEDLGAVTAALVDLGWTDVLEVSPAQAVDAAFTALGTTGSDVGLLDDVVAQGLGLAADPSRAVVLPAPSSAVPPGRRVGGSILVDGLTTRRVERATSVVLAVAAGGEVELRSAPVEVLGTVRPAGLEVGGAVGRARFEVAAESVTAIERPGTWTAAVALARIAVARQLVAACRTMLDLARTHAVDRQQFGRAIASFQAVRHKLAEVLVSIVAAEEVIAEWTPAADPLLAMLAKSLAGGAGRTTSKHCQQVLAGIGFTSDHDFQRFMKRTMVLEQLFGSRPALQAEMGAELLARNEAPRLVQL